MTGAFSSKSAVLKAIKDGDIIIDNKIMKNPNFQIGISRFVLWNKTKLFAIRKKTYIVLNKPAGFLSSKLSKNDELLRKKSVFSLLKGLDEQTINTLFCVGRLDEDTTGLLIITNDGELSHKTTNPLFSVHKKYLVTLEQDLSSEAKKRLEQGVIIILEENNKKTAYKTKPCTINFKDQSQKQLIITLAEGKKREVKRMIETVKNKVTALERISIGCLELDELDIPKGQYKTFEKDFLLNKINCEEKSSCKH